MVAVPAELDLTIADGLREALLGVLNAGALGLVVDMTTTTFCDSAGITAITRAVRRARRERRDHSARRHLARRCCGCLTWSASTG